MADEIINTRIVADADFSALIADVHRVTASLSKLQEQLSNSNKMLANNVAVINRGFADTLRSTGQYSSHFVSLTSNVDKFGQSLDSGRLKLKDYFSTYQSHIKTSGGLIRDLAKQQVAMQNAILQPLGRNAQGLMQFNVHVPRGLDAIKNKTALANQELRIMNKVIQDGAVQLINWGKNTQWAGRQLTVGLTLPLATFGKAAADAFAKADQELTRLTKVYGGVAATSAAELKKIRTEVAATASELAKQYGASFQETIGLAADIAATGKQGNELLASTKETTRLAVLGEVDRQDAMKATLSLQTAFKQNTEQLSESINFLNAVENQTSTSLADLIEAIPKAGPVIQGLGGSVKDLALYLTAMREGGISAAEGANALKSGLASLINPTNKAVDQFKGFGIDLLGIVNKNAGNVTGTLLELQGALDKLNPLQKQQAIENLFGKFQFARMNALFENLGKQGSQTLQVLDLMKASTADLANIAGRELSAVTESASGKYRRALESLKADLAGVGEQFLTVGTKLINIIDKALQFFEKLPKPVKTALTFIAGLTALAGPLIMLTGLLANFFGYVVKGAMHMKAFLKGGEGWKYLTPEMLAAEKAGKLVEQTFYSDAKAASILQVALKNLIDEFSILEMKAKSGSISVQPAVSTMAGNMIMAAGGRVVNPSHPLAGLYGTRASTHMVPRSSLSEEQRMQQTIFGLVPGSEPVNRKIGQNPQIYMHDQLPNVPGLTTVNGVSTGVVSAEAARWHAMMATLGMQSKEEIANLKKTIATTGVVSKEFMNQFDQVLPVVSSITDNAAKESALIVGQLRAGKITVDQAKTQIIELNLQIERMISEAMTAQATAMGRTLNPTMVPTLNQPVVDATGKSNMRELFKKGKTKDLINRIAGSLGVRTSGAGYNIETTRPRKYNTGGTVVGGPRSDRTDTQYMVLNEGDFVLNRNASDNLLGFNKGGEVPAMVTPGEIVIHSPTSDEIDMLTAYNNRFALGGRVTATRTGYGRPHGLTMAQSMQAIRRATRFHDDPGYNDNIRIGAITSDASILHGMGMDPNAAIQMATADYDDAVRYATGKDGTFSMSRFTRRRTQQLKQIQNFRKQLGITGSPISQITPGGKGARRAANFKTFEKGIGSIHDLIMGSDKFSAGSKSYLGGLNLLAPQGQRGWARGHYERFGGLDLQGLEYLYQAAPIPGSVNNFWALTESKGYERDLLPPVAEGKGGARAVFGRALASAVRAVNPNLRAPKPADILATRNKTGIQQMLQRALAVAYMPRRAMARLAVGGLVTGGVHGYGYPSLFGRSKNPLTQQIRGIQHGDIRAAQEKFNSLSPQEQARLLHKRGYGASPVDLGMPGSGRSQQLAAQISSRTSSSRFRNVEPINYGHLIQETSGHSFPIKGVGGIYKNPSGEGFVFVKPMMDETAALAELRATEIARRAHGLKTPRQTIRVMKDPTDVNGNRTFIALQSPYDPAMSAGGSKFTRRDFFKQLVASLVRGDKDLSTSNVFGPYVADVGTAGVFSRASGSRSFSFNMPSMQDQAMINLLGIKGGAKKAFAENTSGIARRMTPDQYHDAIISEINTVLPKMKEVVSSFKLTRMERKVYERMIKRLEDGLHVDWRQYQKVHANVQPKKLALGGLVSRRSSNYGRRNKAAEAAMEADFQAQNRGSGKLFGVGMAASIAGSFMPQGSVQQNVLMSLGQAASFAAMIPQISKLVGVGGKAINIFKMLGNVIKGAALAIRGFAMANPILLGVTAALTGLFFLWKKHKADVEKNRANETAMFGLSKKGAAELGIQYTTITDKMKAVREEQKLMADNARAKFEAYTSAGVTGISLTIKQLKDLKEQVKTSMPDMLKTLDNLDSSQVTQWAANVKAQMVAAGKSVQDANNLIYALIESSNKAGMGVSALTDKAFNSIQDKGSAAAFTMKTLADNFDKVASIDSQAFASNIDSAINATDSLVNSLIGTKDANGKILDQSDALAKVYDDMEKSGVKTKAISAEVLATIQKERPELAAILTKSDTIGGMYAKWRLVLSGVNLDLQKLSSAQAEMLSQFQAGLDAAAAAALTVGNNLSGVPNVASVLKGVNDAQLAAAKKAQAAMNGTLGANKTLIKQYQDQIKLIRDTADAKKKALQDTLNAENTQVELQKLQLDYQAALARGDKDAAAQAQLSIRQLTKQFEVQKAMDKIDANAKKEEAAVQAKIDAENAKDGTATSTGASNQKLADRLATTAATITKLANTYTTLGKDLADANMMTGTSKTKALAAVKDNFSVFMKDLVDSANKDPKVAEAFSNLLVKGKDGKYSAAESKTYRFPKQGEVTMGGAFDQLQNLSSSMTSFAKDLMGKNGITLSEIDSTLKAGFKLGSNKAITISQAQINSAIKTNQGSSSGFLKDPSSQLTKEGYLQEGVRNSLLTDKSLNLKTDQVYEIAGYKYRVAEDWRGHRTLVRQNALGGFIRRAVSGVSGIMGTTPYLVGERGPELFVPSGGGQIIPNNMLNINTPRYNIPTNTISGVNGGANNSYNNNVYNIDIALNGTNVTADDVMRKFKAELALVNAREGRVRTVGGSV